MSLPFSLFVSLLENIQKCKPFKPPFSRVAHPKTTPYDVFERWVNYVRSNHSPLSPGTTRIVFLLLFPEDDCRRKYDIQEKRLVSLLTQCYPSQTVPLNLWNHETSTGCLGAQLYQLLSRSYMMDDKSDCSLDIFQVDLLLDELAALSKYSHESLHTQYPTPRPRSEIIRILFQQTSPLEASFLTQIILKDLRPILSGLSTMDYTSVLLEYKSNAVKYLTKEDAMRLWDPSGRMLRLSRVHANLDDVARAFEQGDAGPQPVVGRPIKIPKCVKGQGVHHALRQFKHSNKVWAETKYDGERCQIHVKILPEGQSCITIFSKSLRESTWDRAGVHDIIRRALGIHEGGVPRIKENVVLEAEMVAHNGEHIDEFWRIRALIASTAIGARRRNNAVPETERSQPSMISDYDLELRHLALVFFDILVLDSESCLFSPYSERRRVLENILNLRPGFAMLAERTPIVLDWQQGLKSACRTLDDVFSDLSTKCEEGAVLKSDEGQYNRYGNPWVKLKRDYIPGLGDTIDLVALGCTWDPDRGKELGVPPSVATTLYVGALANAEVMKQDPNRKPHFHIYFTVSYGMTREQLEDCNFYIRHSGRVPFKSVYSRSCKTLSYTFDMLSAISKPTYMFEQPLLVELMGAGFSKSPQSSQYELRFPRIQKLYRRSERGWRDALSLEDLHTLALSIVGRDSSTKQARDEVNKIWGIPVSPGSKCSEKRKRLKREWESKLALADGRSPKKYKPSTPSPLKPEFLLETPKQTLLPLTNLTFDSTPESPRHTRHSSRGTSLFSGCSKSFRDEPPLTSPASSGPIRHSNMSSLTKPSVRQPGVEFLSTAFVYIAQLPPQAAETATSTAIPDFQRLHTLDALLFGCGWSSPAGFLGCDWVDKGVIFLDEKDQVWGKYIRSVLENASQNRSPGRKPIYVFELMSLKYCFVGDNNVDIIEPLYIYE